ncbi:MAG: response regulator transcription factor [Actinomycetota bacterium]|nr:response regulator transcription factor [Actinomycetota bacterium]
MPSTLSTLPDPNRAPSKGAVLIVDKDPHVLELLADVLRSRGFTVHGAADGLEGLRRAREIRPDAVILEVELPGVDDFELLPQLRAHGVRAPCIFLSGRTTLPDRLSGLSVGGEDYVTKPFSPDEVVARLGAILRRTELVSAASPRSMLRYADLELYEDSLEACRAGRFVALSATEFELLRYLMVNARIILSKNTIRDHVWHTDIRRKTTIVESYVCHLRRKVDCVDSPLIHTVRGMGYVLREGR